MSTIALVGHRGFVGQAVAAAVERRGHVLRPIELPRVSADPEDLAAAVDRWVAADELRWSGLVDELSGALAVINAAGAALPDSEDHGLLWSSNVLLATIVARATAQAGVRRLVHISSAAVQGDRPVLDESTDTTPLSPYARSKAEAERSLLAFAVTWPTSVVVYRPTSVMGSGRRTTERLLSAVRRGIPVVDRDTPLPLALVQNVGDAAAFLAVADSAPEVVTHPDEGITVGVLADLAGGRVIRVPESLVQVGVSALRKAESHKPGLAGIRRRVQLLVDGQQIQAHALHDLGWKPPCGLDEYRSLVHAIPGLDRPIRLAYLITRSDTIAGAQVHVRDLSEAMTNAGHEVRVFVGGIGPLVDQLRERGVDVATVPRLERALGLRDVAALADIRRALREFQPDLLSCHSSKSGILGRIAGRSLGIPTIFTAHGWSFADGIPARQRQIYTQAEKVMAPLATRLVTVAHKDRELAEARHVGRPGQHVTIHNAVHDVRPEQLADAGAEPPTIVSIARLDEQKDHGLLFRALAGLESPPRVRLVGDGPREAGLRRQVEEEGLAGHIEFLGLRHDVPDILAAAQIYVLVSNWEGLPRSIIEALRAGLPVIATDVGGVSELVDDGVNGRLLPHGDLRALDSALRDLVGDPDLRRRMGTASRRRYENHFTFERVLAETRSVYTDVLGVEV